MDRTEKTDILISQIQDPMRNFIVTTIDKMHNAVKKDKYAKLMEPFSSLMNAIVVNLGICEKD